METMIIVVLASAVSSAVSFVVANKLNNAKFDIYTEKAKTKAKLIEHEAQTLLKEAKQKARLDYDKEFYSLKRALDKKQRELDKFVDDELYKINQDKIAIKNAKTEVTALQKGLEAQKKIYDSKIKKHKKYLKMQVGLQKMKQQSLCWNK